MDTNAIMKLVDIVDALNSISYALDEIAKSLKNIEDKVVEKEL